MANNKPPFKFTSTKCTPTIKKILGFKEMRYSQQSDGNKRYFLIKFDVEKSNDELTF